MTLAIASMHAHRVALAACQPVWNRNTRKTLAGKQPVPPLFTWLLICADSFAVMTISQTLVRFVIDIIAKKRDRTVTEDEARSARMG